MRRVCVSIFNGILAALERLVNANANNGPAFEEFNWA